MAYAEVVLPYDRYDDLSGTYDQVQWDFPPTLGRGNQITCVFNTSAGQITLTNTRNDNLYDDTRWRATNISLQLYVSDTQIVRPYTIDFHNISFHNRNIDRIDFEPTSTQDMRVVLTYLQILNNINTTLRFAYDSPPHRMRLGNNEVGGLALGSNRLGAVVRGGDLLWSAPVTGSQGFVIPSAGQRAGRTFFEWAGTIPTRFDMGENLRGILLETANSGQAHLYFDRPLYASEAMWFWQSTQRPDPSDPEDAYQTQQDGSIDISSEAIASLGTVSGLYRYNVALVAGGSIGSYTPTITALIGVMARAATNNATFVPWNVTFNWTES